jgi:hypothetical protein
MFGKLAKCATLALALFGAPGAWAIDESLESIYHADQRERHGAYADERGGADRHLQHVAGVPEPSEWIFMGIGIALIGAVARRRHTRFLKK